MSLQEKTSYFHGSVYPPKEYLLANLPVLPMAIGTDSVFDHRYENNLICRIPLNFLIFQYTVSGCGELKHNGRSFRLSPGTAFLVEAPDNFQYQQSPDFPNWQFIYISLIGPTSISCGKKIIERSRNVFKIAEESNAVKLLVHLLESYSTDGFPDIYTASSDGYQFLMSLLQTQSLPDKQDANIPENLLRTTAFVRSHLSDRSVNIQKMAYVAELSRFYFTRLFKKYYSISPGEYLLLQRLNHAADLLTHSHGISIKSILDESGFASESYFCRVFRKRFGMTVGTYRTRIAFRQKD